MAKRPPTLAEAKALGMKVRGIPGAYVYQGGLHFDVAEVLAGRGIPVTRENVDAAAEELRRAAVEQLGHGEILDDTEARGTN